MLGVTSVTGIVSFGICYIAYRINTYLLLAVMIVMCWQCIAAKSLRDAALAVYVPLSKGDVEGARKAVSMIVGRDTQSLDDKGITKAQIEELINSNQQVWAELNYATRILRANPLLDELCGQFGLTPADVDEMFGL